MPSLEPSEAIPGVVAVTPDVHRDERGSFLEAYRAAWFPGRPPMVQANRAARRAGTVVGLHVHRRQADYWTVVSGRARVVLHDLRPGPVGGATLTYELGGPDDDGADHLGLYVPPGVAHGFHALTDMTITYLVDGYYNPADELGVAWDDPEIGADWGVTDPVVSARDQQNPPRSALPADRRPHVDLRQG